MKHAVAPEHFHFFEHNQAIEFDALLSSSQLEGFLQGIQEVMANRLDVEREQLKYVPSDQLFLKGRDLWRSHPSVKGIVLQQSLAEVAGTLLGERPLRIGYDQLLPFFRREIPPFYHGPKSLKEISSLQGVLGGLILCLEGNESLNAEEQIPFPTVRGNGVFFKADLLLDFTQLQHRPSCLYMLIAYTHSMTAYIYKKDDPHTHALRDWGYGIGDPLTNLKNPLVYK